MARLEIVAPNMGEQMRQIGRMGSDFVMNRTLSNKHILLLNVEI